MAVQGRGHQVRTFGKVHGAGQPLKPAHSYVEEACLRNTGTLARIWRRKVKKDLTYQQHISFKARMLAEPASPHRTR